MMRPGFTGGTLDRADHLRQDADGVARARIDLRARLLVLNGAEPEVDEAGLLGWTSLAEAPDGAELILLGLDDGRPRFAAHVPGTRVSPQRSPALFRALDQMQPGEAATYAAARSLIDWHARHGFCANCGGATTPFKAGWARSCGGCGGEHFPRVDPVVIMIAEHEGRALLGRGANWPERRYSALAGFVEPGESIEEAVAREIAEEAGVRVADVRYIASQPWPFPSSLMIACVGAAEHDAITLDTTELEDAIWVSRAEVRAALAGEDAPFIAAPPYAIAHTLLSVWAAERAGAVSKSLFRDFSNNP
ncbi:NAD+ diphosphatase [Hephaestia caeni]|uniref:NAD(+) diphosphatase n=1 Tax=Hephaestia caeni TaxID=645617 RepID=A0A397NSZ2_9SPHN|nr:NAD(+) diphosphatase [Hephaestia caeni]RIA37845.1 NAD+ diphosphatase [Hephaestia caeni]